MGRNDFLCAKDTGAMRPLRGGEIRSANFFTFERILATMRLDVVK